MAETTIIKTGEEAPEAVTESAERVIGHLESEVEHHEEQLAEHTDTLEELKNEGSWINERFRGMEERLSALPSIPLETITALENRIAELERKAEEKVQSLQSSTEPPTQEQPRNDERKKDRGILSHLL